MKKLLSGSGDLALVRDWRVWLLFSAVVVIVVAVFLFPAIPQSQDYHNFADQRRLLGIPNCLNVISNVFFLLVGWLGIRSILSKLSAGTGGLVYIDSGEGWSYIVFFVAVALTAFGSAYYHFDPNDRTLLWDRIPMALGFMALVAATVSERISPKVGLRLLIPLIAVGAGSVVYWEITQETGHGDLRPYVLVQFGSVLVLLVMIGLFPPRYNRGSDLIVAFAIYACAKILEAADERIFALGGIVSGHTLKHIAAAISTYWIFRMLSARKPLYL